MVWGILIATVVVAAVGLFAWRGITQLEEQQRGANRRALERADFLDWEIELALERGDV